MKNWQAMTRSALQASVNAWMPSRPNAQLIRATGGIRNLHGEYENQTKQSYLFTCIIIPLDELTIYTEAGVNIDAVAQIVWNKSSLPVQLQVHDKIIIEEEAYSVLSITPFNLDHVTDYSSALLSRLVEGELP